MRGLVRRTQWRHDAADPAPQWPPGHQVLLGVSGHTCWGYQFNLRLDHAQCCTGFLVVGYEDCVCVCVTNTTKSLVSSTTKCWTAFTIHIVSSLIWLFTKKTPQVPSVSIKTVNIATLGHDDIGPTDHIWLNLVGSLMWHQCILFWETCKFIPKLYTPN